MQKCTIEVIIGIFLLTLAMIGAYFLNKFENEISDRLNIALYNDVKIMEKLNGDFTVKCQ